MTGTRKPTERPTQKTIARLTGLAVPTVSRALAGAPDIGEKTKRRVREVAEEIGYRPDRAGVRLRTGRTNVISLVMSPDHEMMNHTARLLTSIVAALRDTQYHLIVTPYFHAQDPMDPIRYLVETGSADGIILNQTVPDDPRTAYMLERGFPFATHGRTNSSDLHPYYDFDNGAFARIVIDEFKRRNRKTVLLVHPPLDQFYAIEMFEAATEHCKSHGLQFLACKGATCDDPARQIHDAVLAELQANPSIDSVICASSTAAMSTASAAESLGRTVGEDIDLAGKEAIPFLKQFRPNILAVHEDVGRAGKLLAEAVVQSIADPDATPMQEVEIPEKIQ